MCKIFALMVSAMTGSFQKSLCAALTALLMTSVACATSVTIETIKDRLTACDVTGGDTTISQRINALRTILGMSGVYETFTAYKLQKMRDLIGGPNDGNDSSLYTLYVHSKTEDDTGETSETPATHKENYGYPGAFPGELTVHGRLNTLMEIVLHSAVLARLGNPTDTPLENGKTFWSRLNKAAEQFPSDEWTTLIPQMTLLQASLRGIVGLIDSEMMTLFLGEASSLKGLKALESGLESLLSQINTSPEARNGTSLQEVIQNTYREIAQKVGRLTFTSPFTDSAAAPAQFQETFETAQNLLASLNGLNVPFLDLTPLVRVLTHNWPLLLDKRVHAQDDDLGVVTQKIYTGEFIRPGLTLMNALHGIIKVFHVDPLLQKIGRPSETTLDPATLWGALQDEKAKAADPTTFDTAEQALTLVFRLLENTPALGELLVNAQTLTDVLGEVVSEEGEVTAKALKLKEKLDGYLRTLLAEKVSLDFPNYSDDALFPYETLFGLLMNTKSPEESSAHIKKALYAQPLVYEIEGSSYPIQKDALLNQLQAKGAGNVTDFWGTLKAPTACSVARALSRVWAKAGEVLPLRVPGEEMSLGEACFIHLRQAVEEARGTEGVASFYAKTTEPFRKMIEALLGTKTENTGLYQSAETGLTSQPILLDNCKERLDQLRTSFTTCYSHTYPLDFVTIYQNLKFVQIAFENNNIGHVTDHYRDITAFGRINGALFECGAQLILNGLGQVTDPGETSGGTLYAKLRDIELADSSISATVTEIRTKVNALQGQIRYRFKDCLASDESSLFKNFTDLLYPNSAPQWEAWNAENVEEQARGLLEACSNLLGDSDA